VTGGLKSQFSFIIICFPLEQIVNAEPLKAPSLNFLIFYFPSDNEGKLNSHYLYLISKQSAIAYDEKNITMSNNIFFILHPVIYIPYFI
jgi:hypothetical protein